MGLRGFCLFLIGLSLGFFSVSSSSAMSSDIIPKTPGVDSTFTWTLNPGEACLRLAAPADILIGRDYASSHYGPVSPLALAFDMATLTPFTMKNPHAGIVLDIRRADADDVKASKNTLRLGEVIMKRRDFMPDQVFYLILKGKIEDQGRLNMKKGTGKFSIQRINLVSAKGELRARVRAAEKLQSKDKYWGHGLCSGYVDHIYDGKIHRWWNQIPVVRSLIELVPGISMKTPSAIATSPQVQKVCEVTVKDGVETLAYPKIVDVRKWLEDLMAEVATGNALLVDHARLVLGELSRLGVITDTGYGWRVNHESLSFHRR